jgi:hypothetical protein
MPKRTDSIFINYRRQDSSGFAGRLFDLLEEHFGRDRIFMDVDAIPPGVDFVQFLDEQVARTHVMVVIIGRSWAECADDTGRPRLDNPNDFVRVEIEAALKRNIFVVPVLVDDAQMPLPVTLPSSIRPLLSIQGIAIRHESWRSDSAILINALDEILSGGQLGSAPADNRRSKTSANGGSPNLVSAFRQARRDGLSLSRFLATIEEENLRIVDENQDLHQIKEHIDCFRLGLTKSLAQARLEYILWRHVLESRTLKSVSDYLTRFPSGSHAIEARQMQDELLDKGGADTNDLPIIFLNYRRIDSQDSADRIFAKITEWLPKRNVLMDVDKKSITPGLPVRPQLEQLANTCDIMLVLIHNRWLTEFAARSVKHETGEALDFVRVEIKVALDRKDMMPIVPILLGETPAPRASELPEEIQTLMQRSAHKISRDTFDEDLAALIRQMTNYMENRRLR